MPKLKILFICGMNKKRSPTAQKIYINDPRVEVRSAGVGGTSKIKLTDGHIEWADLILVMESKYKEKIKEVYKGALPKIESLEIPDEYEYMDDELIQMIKSSVEPYLS